MATIKDIAKLAQTSITTVSRILNEDTTLSVSQDTRQRVLSIAKELNYVPPRKRRLDKEKSLSTTYNIGLIIGSSIEEEYNDPYFRSIRIGCEKACEQLGMNISTVYRLQSQNKPSKLENLDGMIIIGTIALDDIKKRSSQPIVYVDYNPNSDYDFDVVITDLEQATRNVLDYLLQLKHRHIGYIGGSQRIKTINNHSLNENIDPRLNTFITMMKENRLLNKKDIYIGEWTTNDGYRLMKEAISEGSLPSAMVIGSDPMAIGALHALREENIQVPNDITIISFDDIESASYLNPPLTTVRTFSEEMGIESAKILYDRLQGRSYPLKVVLPTKLIIRDSTTPYNSTK